MSYRSALTQKLRSRPVVQELSALIRALIPPFTAPTDMPAWRRRADQLRKKALAEVFLRGYPQALIKARPRVVWGKTLTPDPSYRIRKLRYEVCPGYWAPALLYEPTSIKGKAPVVLNPNGHHRAGKAADYKQVRCINLARRGMIAMSTEFIGMGELEADTAHNQQAYLSFTGLAGVGLFYLGMSKALDILLEHPRADRGRVAMTGLSGGGWQTIVLAALDKRVTVSIPVAGYMPLRDRTGFIGDIGDLEQAPPDLATILDYQDLTAMLAPRPTLIILNNADDCCFRTGRTKPLVYDRVKPVFAAMGAADRLAFHGNADPGTHNYAADNRRACYRFLDKHFGLATPDGDIHRGDEVLPEEHLNVGLPGDEPTLAAIAAARAAALTGGLAIPRTAEQRRKLRAKLAQVIRLPHYQVRAQVRRLAGGIENVLLKVGPHQVPMTMIGGSVGQAPRLTVTTGGRARQATMPKPKSATLFVPDLLGMGENSVDHRYPMLLESAGQRALGIQAAQLLACARYALKRTGATRLCLDATEPAAAMPAMIAAALHPQLFSDVTLIRAPGSLVNLIHWRVSYESAPALFCPGLLEVVDIPQLTALMEGVTVHQPGRPAPSVRYPLAAVK